MIGRTTICCSAIALAAAHGTTRALQPDTPARFFPAEIAWSVPLGGTLSAPPAFADRRGFFPLDGARLDAFDLARSSRAWTHPVNSPGRPATGDGLVYVTAAGALAALRIDDGSVVWQQPQPEPPAAPAVWSEGRVISASEGGTIAVRRSTDGALIWERHLDAAASGAPAVAAGRVYVPTVDDRIVALEIGTGEPVWTRTIGGTSRGIVARDDRLYVGALDNYLYCLRADTGTIDWRWRTGGDIAGLPQVDDARVYFTSLDNVLRSLDRRSGGQRWLAPLPLRPNTGPVRAGDLLVVSGVSPVLRAYAAGDGRPRGEMNAPGELAAAPHVLDEDGGRVSLAILTRDVSKGTVLTLLRPGAAAPDHPSAPTSRPVAPTERRSAAPATPST